MVLATAFTASKSPLLAAGKPASITSTRMRSSWRAMRDFHPCHGCSGLCSPSRKVVSKMISLSFMAVSGKQLGNPDAARTQAAKVQTEI